MSCVLRLAGEVAPDAPFFGRDVRVLVSRNGSRARDGVHRFDIFSGFYEVWFQLG